MYIALTLAAFLTAPAPLPHCGAAVQDASSNTVFCCALVSGQQCCSLSQDANGKPTGCNC